MNLDELKAAVEASRRFTHTIEIKIDDPAYVRPVPIKPTPPPGLVIKEHVDPGEGPLLSAKALIKEVPIKPVPQIVIGTRLFALRMPTDHEYKMGYMRARTGANDHLAAFTQSQREMAVQAVTGWTELRESDLVAGGSDAPLAFAAELVPLIFDEHPDWQAAVCDELNRRLAERESRQEAAAKNSVSASPGSEPSQVRVATNS